MKKTRIAALLLAALTLVPAVTTSCSGDETKPADTQAVTGTQAITEADTQELDVLDARVLVDDGVETRDFGGAPFRIITCDGQIGFY